MEEPRHQGRPVEVAPEGPLEAEGPLEEPVVPLEVPVGLVEALLPGDLRPVVPVAVSAPLERGPSFYAHDLA